MDRAKYIAQGRMSDNILDARGPSQYRDAVNTIAEIKDAYDYGMELTDAEIQRYNAAVEVIQTTQNHTDRAMLPDPPLMQGGNELGDLAQSAGKTMDMAARMSPVEQTIEASLELPQTTRAVPKRRPQGF